MTDPRCVLQVLKRHYARYTPEMVEQVCGIPRDMVVRIAEELAANSGPERTSAICYAVGWTMHMNGPQIIRSAAILQTLLGNIGRPGGGIMALRGHNNVQGTTDVSTLYETLPGYLAMPDAVRHRPGHLPRQAHRARRAVRGLPGLPGVVAEGLVRRRRDPGRTASGSTGCRA